MLKPAFKSFENLTPYQQGLSEVEGVKKVIKLSSNENPLGCSKKIVKAVKKNAVNFHRYPDGSAKVLRRQIAKKYSLPFDDIIIGAGSDELISLICRGFATEGDEVVYSQHGFAMYPLYALTSGAKAIAARENNYKTEIASVVKAITKKTKVIFLANPNNPTGSYLNKIEVEKLINEIPKSVLLVIDNAYFQYALEKDYSPCFDLLEKHENLCIINTFSKIYGIAALRLGWGVFSKPVANIINRIRSPFSVSNLTLASGQAALLDNDFVKKSIEHNVKSLEFLENSLKKLSLKPYKSSGNFIMVKFPSVEKAQDTFEKMFKKGVVVRNLKAYNIPDALRISVGTSAENKIAMQTLEESL